MKTWQQFNEDANSFARDKKAYEKSNAAKSNLEARRRQAKKRSEKSVLNFVKRSTSSHQQKSEEGESIRNEYNQRRKLTKLAQRKNINFRNKNSWR